MRMEIKPCPFCGMKHVGLTRSEVAKRRYWVECENCMSQGPHTHDAEDAVEAWNDMHRKDAMLLTLYLIADGRDNYKNPMSREDMQNMAKGAIEHVAPMLLRPPD